MKPLKGLKIISTAVNIPGPVALYKLKTLGANVIKIESPEGDVLEKVDPKLYQKLHRGIKVIKLNLKSEKDLKKFYALCKTGHVFLTSFRSQTLRDLKIDFSVLKKKTKKVFYLHLMGFKENELPGHDLNIQGAAGLIEIPHLPKTLWADIASSLVMVEEILKFWIMKNKIKSTYRRISIEEGLEPFLFPLKLTAKGNLLGGGHPLYGIYATEDGYVTVAGLEKKFQMKLESLAKNYQNLEVMFRSHPTKYWCEYGIKEELPIFAVKEGK